MRGWTPTLARHVFVTHLSARTRMQPFSFTNSFTAALPYANSSSLALWQETLVQKKAPKSKLPIPLFPCLKWAWLQGLGLYFQIEGQDWALRRHDQKFWFLKTTKTVAQCISLHTAGDYLIELRDWSDWMCVKYPSVLLSMEIYQSVQAKQPMSHWIGRWNWRSVRASLAQSMKSSTLHRYPTKRENYQTMLKLAWIEWTRIWSGRLL